MHGLILLFEWQVRVVESLPNTRKVTSRSFVELYLAKIGRIHTALRV
jgi:hypothetical protein